MSALNPISRVINTIHTFNLYNEMVDGKKIYPNLFYNMYGYDIESYPNYFSVTFTRITDDATWKFEICAENDMSRELFMFLQQLIYSGGIGVGFNNQNYDYPMLHYLINMGGAVNAPMMWAKTKEFIPEGGYMNAYSNVIWDDQCYFPQIDLFKIHHFDNKAKMTSLKLLEFNMRLTEIQELPYPVGSVLTREQQLKVLEYNERDVHATVEFAKYSDEAITLRLELSGCDKWYLNHNDTRLGSDFFISKLRDNNVYVNKSHQTMRPVIHVRDVILPYIQFQRPEFQQILERFRGARIYEGDLRNIDLTGESEEDDDTTEIKMSTVIDGLSYDYGAGGVHASRRKTIVRSNSTHVLIDSDVASYYPNLAISNNFYPEHLTEVFCAVYLSLYDTRKTFEKGTSYNNMYKLALNGTYGKSNDVHSPFYDPLYTIQITVNGQLLLTMLAEWLLNIPGLRMIQLNTDGLTYLCPREYEGYAMSLSKQWEQLTRLELEHAHYEVMAIRDVNNYMAKTTSGKVKRIGTYGSVTARENPATRELTWNKNHSAVVINKAAQAAILDNKNIRQFITEHLTVDPMDFMLRTKVPRSSRLVARYNGNEYPVQNITRYYASNCGLSLVKVMPYTEKQLDKWLTEVHWKHETTGKVKVGGKRPSGKYHPSQPESMYPPDREIGISKETKVTVCNRITDPATILRDVNIDWYVAETEKIVNPLLLNPFN